jgi:hypothetical protein
MKLKPWRISLLDIGLIGDSLPVGIERHGGHVLREDPLDLLSLVGASNSVHLGRRDRCPAPAVVSR